MTSYNSRKPERFIFGLLFTASVLMFFLIFSSYTADYNIFSKFGMQKARAFRSPEILAKNAYVYDISTNTVLFEKNAASTTYLASLAKIMTAVVASEELDPQKDIIITTDAIAPPDYLQSSQGEGFARDELIRFMLFVSSNTAANALKDAATKQDKGFVFLMNKRARELGLKSMSFMNPSGLDSFERDTSSYGNAEDVVKLFAYATERHPDLFSPGKYKEYNFVSIRGNNYFATNTNEAAEKIPGLYASKTGFTALAGGNLVIGFETNQHKVIVAVLGSDKESRFSDVLSLVDEAINVLSK